MVRFFALIGERKFLKSIHTVKEDFKGSRTSYLLRVFVKVKGNRLLVLPSDDLILYIYSLPEGSLEGKIALQKPSFFKPLRKPLFLKSGLDPRKIDIMRNYLHSWTVPIS